MLTLKQPKKEGLWTIVKIGVKVTYLILPKSWQPKDPPVEIDFVFISVFNDKNKY